MDSSDDQSEHSQEENESSVEEGSSDDDSQDEEDDVPKLADDEFKEIPFEDLLKLQKKLGTRMYNEAIFGKTSDKQSQAEATKSSKKRKFEPDCSNSESDDDSGPEEVSARRKVPQLGKTKKRNYDEANQRPRDPRFDPQQGYFNGRKFREDYGFVNDMRTKELKKLQNRMQSATDPEEGAKLKFLVQRTGNQIREYAKQRKLDETKRQEKQQARQAIKDGKRPFYERKSTKQARELVEQYDRLKQDGKLAKHIDKRRKKVSAKDRKKLDFST